jgi:hypothetical protein
MGAPAFQLTGTQSTASGAFGSAAFGTSPFGGNMYAALDVPEYHLGSDDLTESHHRAAGRIVHQRHGLTVSVRQFATTRRWAVRHSVLAEAKLSELRAFFDAGSFNFLQTGDPSNPTYVRWVGDQFAPEYLSPGKYTLSYEIEEILQ